MRSASWVLLSLAFLTACAARPRPVPLHPIRSAAAPETGRPRSTTVYQCGDERLVVAAWVPERVSLHGSDFVESLGRVGSSTGVRYRGADTELWIKSDDATFIRQGVTRSACVRLPEEEPWEAARLASASFRAAGHVPVEWSLENGYGEGLVLRVANWERKYPRQTPAEDSLSGALSFSAGEGVDAIAVELLPQPCKDSVTGKSYESTVSVEWGELPYKGCGKSL